MSTPKRDPAVGSLYELFGELVELDPAAREARVEALGRQDPAAAAELHSLLAADAKAAATLALFENPTSRLAHRALSAGEHVGSYEIVGEIGRGGMGTVYLAHDARLDRRAALKVLPPARAGDEGARAQLLQEARTVAALDHPHVATIYEIGEDGEGRLFVAMAYLEGPTLRARLAQGRLPIEEALRIGHQMATALEAAHRVGVVHRDVKPENVILTPRGAQVIDFGIARAVEHAFAGSRGTLPYVAPEAVTGQAVDHRADQWALGVVLYEMLSGRHPFACASSTATRERIVCGECDAIGALRADLPPGCARLVHRLLSVDPDGRFERTGALVEAIGAVLALGGRRPATRLPIPATRFIGREQQLWQIRQLLQRTRLLTLTGTGGTGKTRLAIEIAARELDHFPGGVYFVPLAPLSAPEEVPSAIIGTLDIPEVAGMTLEGRIAAALGEEPSLLLIDNFEHVLEAAVLVPRLLAAVPALKILVTSRAALRLSDEVEYTVPPLTQPVQLASPEHLERFESVELFVECARKARPGFELHGADAQVVAEMCRRLDGLPLAIELAAARLKVLAPGDVLARLSDRFALLTSGPQDAPERHRTLRAALAWSYDLLLPSEKQLFRRLSVFAGGCTLPAAAEVGGLEDAALVDALAALVDHNLVVRTDAPGHPPRFSMLETIREFARDLLKQSGEEADARKAHRRFFLDLAERLAPTLRGGDQARSLAILDAEHANLRVALDLAAQEPPLEARLTIALSTFWLMRGYLAEGRERVARALGRTGLSTAERADLLAAAGTYGHNIGEYREARELLEDALACHRQTGNERGVADALNHIGWVAWRLASYSDAIALSNEALDLQRRLGNGAGIAASLNNLGWTAQYRGEMREAVGYLEETLAIRRRLDNPRATAFAKCNLGAALTHVGRYDEAEELLVEAVDHFRAIGDRQLLGFSCARLASLHHALGDHQRAVDRLVQESIPIFRSIGDRWGLACALAYLGSALAWIDAPERAEEALAESLELRRATDDRHGEADALTRLGELARLKGDAPTAISHFDAALRVLAGIDSRDRVPACLESVALLYHAHGMQDSAAALLAAADQLRAETGAARPPQQ